MYFPLLQPQSFVGQLLVYLLEWLLDFFYQISSKLQLYEIIIPLVQRALQHNRQILLKSHVLYPLAHLLLLIIKQEYHNLELNTLLV